MRSSTKNPAKRAAAAEHHPPVGQTRFRVTEARTVTISELNRIGQIAMDGNPARASSRARRRQWPGSYNGRAGPPIRRFARPGLSWVWILERKIDQGGRRGRTFTSHIVEIASAPDAG